MFDSAVAHAILIGLLYALSAMPHPSAHLESAALHTPPETYSISPYLPELHGPRAVQNETTIRHIKAQADPGAAAQEIVSLPETPDNFRQTIIAPPKIKLEREFNLPNIAAYAPVNPVQPLAASQQESTAPRLPSLLPEVVAPAVDASSVQARKLIPRLEPDIVEPTPDLAKANPRLALPAFQPKVVEPAPDVSSVNHRVNSNLNHLNRSIPEPIPEAPQVARTAASGSAQIIALNLHPADVHAPVELPSGNRRGTFIASPSGRADATGKPPGNGVDRATAPGSTAPPNAPAGIDVARAPSSSAIPAPDAPTANPGVFDNNAAPKMIAAMSAPIASVPSRPPARELTEPRNDLEKRLFGGRRSYSMLVNMPDLNATTGSWIIHFAERDPAPAHSAIAAPEVLKKSDPAYPGEFIRDGVQGTVILTAVIHADGSVGDIAIAQSLNPALDLNAAQALSRWQFRPALRDGAAIDLEAVITVPFRSRTRF